ncbi:MAG TPA: hypothetical protein VI277_06345 [Candidatus Limnocylindria bacterium]
MARPRAGDGRIDLSPRARLIGGWLAAVLLVLGIAAGVRLLGGNADGSAPVPTPGASASGSPLPITFGTALGDDRLVTSASATTRFTPDDTFAYSVADAEPASTVYVAVERTGGGPLEVVQPASDPQAIPNAPALIGFTVPAANLFEAFGAGTYRMTISLEPDGPPLAEGTFELIQPAASASDAGG